MRPLFVFLMCFLTIPAAFAQTEMPRSIMNATEAVRIFHQSCFTNFFTPEKTKQWADAHLDALKPEQAKPFIAYTGAKEASVWTSRADASSSIALVLQPNGTCTILTYGADEEAVHMSMQGLADVLAEQLPDKRISHEHISPGEKSAHTLSIVKIRQPERDSTAILVADTVPGDAKTINASVSVTADFIQ